MGGEVAEPTPNRRHRDFLPASDILSDFPGRIVTMLSNSVMEVSNGVPIHQYHARRNMHRVFPNMGGELLFVP